MASCLDSQHTRLPQIACRQDPYAWGAKTMAGCVPELAWTSDLKSCCCVSRGMHLHAPGLAIWSAVCGCMLQRHV